jgi:hypothetical protein
MFCVLLNLALVGTALSLLSPCGPLLGRVASPDAQMGSAKPSLQALLLRAPLLNTDAERDCIDDTDNSDESAFVTGRMQEFGRAIRRSVQLLFRSRFVTGTLAPGGVSVPLFYVFCALLI